MSDFRWRSNRHRDGAVNALKTYGEVIIYDTETTGFNEATDRVIELAAIKYSVTEDGALIELSRLHEYIRPPFLISEKITEFTGITNEKLAEHLCEEEVFPAILAFFGDSPAVVSGHNVGFDNRFLSAMYARNGYTLTLTNIVDTLEMARDLISKSETESYKLSSLAKLFGLDEGVGFHSAIEDVQVTAQLFQIFFNEYLEKTDVTNATGDIKPHITRVAYWGGPQGLSRIYVTTNYGSIYYDIRYKIWSNKDAPIETFDMEYIESRCLAITGCNNLIQFAAFRGSITVPDC